MDSSFIGRSSELAILQKRLNWVTSDGTGAALAIRGRRQVGKSRLVQEFCDRSGRPYFFFTAIKGASPVESVRRFVAALKSSTLVDDPDSIPEVSSGSWLDALGLLASLIGDTPVVVVFDEVPWLSEQDRTFDGVLQLVWDRQLSRKPVFLILLGSDVHMMERLTSYDQPFHGRADSLTLNPFNPGQTAAAVQLSGVDALDAHLVSGGIPGILHRWPTAMPVREYFRQECEDPSSPLFSVPATALMSEFPTPDTTRRVLDAVGAGDRTHANIASSAGSHQGAVASGTLAPILRRLVHEKRVLAMEEPLSIKPGRPALFHVADSNLRLYLAMARDAQEETYRGRPDRAFRILERRWTSWRGRAIEPIVREAVEVACGDGVLPWEETEVVGGWWNRQFDPEIDLVGADRSPIAKRIFFAGSVKWLGSPFDSHDLAALRNGAAMIPGFDSETRLMAVTLSGVRDDLDLTGVDAVWGADDVLQVWQLPDHFVHP